jgi:hypothetical protein
VFSTDGSFTATGTATDTAGNTASVSFGPILIDKTAPTLAPVVSPNPVYLNGSATVTANATDSGSGIATQSCGALVTNTVGTKTVTCTATDIAGNTATVSVSYQVIYRFEGFLSPVSIPGHTGVCASPCPFYLANRNSTIPIKFQLKDANGNVVQTAALPIWITPQRGSVLSVPIDGFTFPAPVASGTTISRTGQQYHYNWKTKDFASGYYWRIGVKLDDGQTYFVIVGLR